MPELSFTDRFFTALKVTMKHYFRDITVISVLYAILDDYSNNKVSVFGGKPISKNKANEIKSFFLMVFQDDENVRSFLDQEISANYWQKQKTIRKDFDETQAIVDIIVKTELSKFLTS